MNVQPDYSDVTEKLDESLAKLALKNCKQNIDGICQLGSGKTSCKGQTCVVKTI